MKFKLNKKGNQLLNKLYKLFDLEDFFGLEIDYHGECNNEFNVSNYLRQCVEEIGKTFTKEKFLEEFDDGDGEKMWLEIQPYIEMIRPIN
jgi:hypothetical protein